MRLSHSLLFIIPVILILSACSSTTSSIKAKLSFLGVNYTPYSQVPGTNFRGQLYYDNEQAYFKYCNSNMEYEITENNNLYDIYETVLDAQEEEQPVYVEFLGEINFPTQYKTNSPIVIKVERVHHMASMKVSLQCAKATDTFYFKAKGNDPYWRVNAHNKHLFFATKANNDSYQFSNMDIKIDLINHLEGINDKGESLFVEVAQKHCYIIDNKEYWEFTTKIKSIHGEFNGCGELGHLNNTSQFKGVYINQTEDISLTLNENHTVKYQQTDNGLTSLKTGFWKSNTQETVVIMFSTENDNAIQEELIFTHDKTKLFTQQINKNNTINEFEKVLTLSKKTSQQDELSDNHPQIKRKFTAQLINPEETVDSEVKDSLKTYFKIHQTDPKNTQFNSVRFDLNGDGLDDAIALLDWCAGDQCEMIIFEATNDGLEFSSRVSRVQAPILISQDLHFLWQSLMLKAAKNWLSLDFDGLSYPLHTQDARSIKELENATGVTLFSQGKPSKWFPIQ